MMTYTEKLNAINNTPITKLNEHCGFYNLTNFVSAGNPNVGEVTVKHNLECVE